MSEDLNVIQGTKEEQYQSLLPQIKGLLEGETDFNCKSCQCLLLH